MGQIFVTFSKYLNFTNKPTFAPLPIPLVLVCPTLLDPPSPPKIGHNLWTFPGYIHLSLSSKDSWKYTYLIGLKGKLK